jgi:hypothetical protein
MPEKRFKIGQRVRANTRLVEAMYGKQGTVTELVNRGENCPPSYRVFFDGARHAILLDPDEIEEI